MSTGEIRTQTSEDVICTKDVTKGQTVNAVSRDPKHINETVTVTFEDILAEPHSSIHSFDSVWVLSQKSFSGTRLWCYRLLTLIFAIPLSVIWGGCFAVLSCCTVWCSRPCIKAYQIKMAVLAVRKSKDLYLDS